MQDCCSSQEKKKKLDHLLVEKKNYHQPAHIINQPHSINPSLFLASCN